MTSPPRTGRKAKTLETRQQRMFLRQRNVRIWRLIESATPLDLLARLRIHRRVNPNKPLPEHLQRAIGRAWGVKP